MRRGTVRPTRELTTRWSVMNSTTRPTPIEQRLLDLLRQNQGTAYTAHALSALVPCATNDARVALDALAQTGIIERQEAIGGPVTYIVPKYAT